MSDRKTIKIDADAFEHHNERRKDLGLTWEQYINGEAPDAPDGVGDLRERLDDVEAAAREATAAAQSAERSVEELAEGRR